MCILIEPQCIQAVFEAIRAETGLTLRRSYIASGKFVKQETVQEDVDNEDDDK